MRTALLAGLFVLSFAAPGRASAQVLVSFDGWTDRCITSGNCMGTDIYNRGVTLAVANPSRCVSGECLEAGFPRLGPDYHLDPVAGDWAPDAGRIAVSLHYRLGPEHIGSEDGFVELVRVYTGAGDTTENILLEYVRSGGDARLVWQLETTEDVPLSIPCQQMIVPDEGWHFVLAWISVVDGECSIQSGSGGASGTFPVSDDTFAPLREVIVGGSGGFFDAPGAMSRAAIDDVCIGTSPEECESPVFPPPIDGGVDAGLDAGRDGGLDAGSDVGVVDADTGGRRDGSSTPPSVFRGAGGCDCHSTGRMSSPSILFAWLGVLVLLFRRR